MAVFGKSNEGEKLKSNEGDSADEKCKKSPPRTISLTEERKRVYFRKRSFRRRLQARAAELKGESRSMESLNLSAGARRGNNSGDSQSLIIA